MRILVLITTLFFIHYGSIYAQTSTNFEMANEAYAKGEYEKAIQNYEAILAKGEHAPELYYNLANSYYQANKLGKAILNYERALLLDRNDENTIFNLALAKSKVQGEIDPIPPFFLRSWWNSWRGALSSTAWGIIAILLLWAAIAGLSVWQIGKEKTQKKKGFFAGIVLLVISILPLSLAWSAYQYEQKTNEAIIINKVASLKSGADENSKEVRQVYEGTKLELLDQINIWYKVRLANGETGWLAGSSFEEI